MEKNKPDFESITIHSDQADYYKYRTPYIPQVFNAVCEELGVKKTSTLMDIGCGRGEVANILANLAGKVYAIDGSKEMVDLAIKREEIEYQIVDLNKDNPVIRNKADHIFFGRSIHWFPPESLSRFSTCLLADKGKIIVCSSQWAPIGDWGAAYFETRKKFLKQGVNYKCDFTGRSNLNMAGFYQLKKFSLDRTFKVNISFMIGHTFATTYLGNLERLKSLSAQFENEMKICLKTYEETRKMKMRVTTWAIIYGKSSKQL